MGERRRSGGPRLLRRGVALALALVGLWALSLTADFPGASDALTALGEDPDFVMAALNAELGAREDQELTGWGRLLIRQSALLSGGQQAVVQRLSEGEEHPDEPILIQGDDDGNQEPDLAPAEDSKVVERTSTGKDGGNYLSADGVYLANRAGLDVDVAALAAAPVELELGADGPQILIVHTHGSEAYTPAGEDVYVASDPYRTTDCLYNVVRVGEEMAKVFRDNGFQVIHDTNLYDYPAYNGAYERSRTAVQGWLAQYPSIRFILDVHRDALADSDGTPYKLVTTEGEEKVAQVMLVVGSNDSGAEHPNWRKNLALAVHMQLQLTADHTSLARPITLRSSRFNQDLSPGFLLVEVGGHGNTLQEAVAGAELFAQSAAKVLQEFKSG